MTTKEEKWGESFAAASAEISQWRQKHRQASLTDIEQTVDEQLAQVRREMIETLIQESALTDMTRLEPGERPRCPGCGQPLVSNGRQKRKLVTTHEQVINVERSKGYCQQCQTSHFPPG